MNLFFHAFLDLNSEKKIIDRFLHFSSQFYYKHQAVFIFKTILNV